jgi:hypothetical protein
VVSVWRGRPFPLYPLYPPFLVIRSARNSEPGSRLGRFKRIIPCTWVIAWQHLLSWNFFRFWTRNGHWVWRSDRDRHFASRIDHAHVRLANGRFVMVYPVVPSMNEARAGFEIS